MHDTGKNSEVIDDLEYRIVNILPSDATQKTVLDAERQRVPYNGVKVFLRLIVFSEPTRRVVNVFDRAGVIVITDRSRCANCFLPELTIKAVVV